MYNGNGAAGEYISFDEPGATTEWEVRLAPDNFQWLAEPLNATTE